MNFLVKILFTFFIINAILIIFRLFVISMQSIKFSIWVKLLPLQLLIALTIIFLISLSNNGSIYEQPKSAISICIFLFYSVYSVSMFRYHYKKKYFDWFNGIFLVKFNEADIAKIIMYKNKKIKAHTGLDFK